MSMTYAQQLPTVHAGEAGRDPVDHIQLLAETMQDNWALIANAAQTEPGRYPGYMAGFDSDVDKATLRQLQGTNYGVHTSFYKNETGIWCMERMQYMPSKEADGVAQGGLTVVVNTIAAAEGVPSTTEIGQGVMHLGELARIRREKDRLVTGEALTPAACESLMGYMSVRCLAAIEQPAAPPSRLVALAKSIGSALWNPVGGR